jgi:hypothetical protein
LIDSNDVPIAAMLPTLMLRRRRPGEAV